MYYCALYALRRAAIYRYHTKAPNVPGATFLLKKKETNTTPDELGSHIRQLNIYSSVCLLIAFSYQVYSHEIKSIE